MISRKADGLLLAKVRPTADGPQPANSRHTVEKIAPVHPALSAACPTDMMRAAIRYAEAQLRTQALKSLGAVLGAPYNLKILI
jgi:hypothetical protein